LIQAQALFNQVFITVRTVSGYQFPDKSREKKLHADNHCRQGNVEKRAIGQTLERMNEFIHDKDNTYDEADDEAKAAV